MGGGVVGLSSRQHKTVTYPLARYLPVLVHEMLAHGTEAQPRTIVSRVDGELDDGVADVCLRFSGGEGFFGGSG